MKKMVNRFGIFLFGVGVALLGEHIISKGFTTWEILGHETYGIVAIIISFIMLSIKEKEE